MPLLYDLPEPDPIGLAEGVSLLPVSDRLAWRTLAKDYFLTGRALGGGQAAVQASFERQVGAATGYSNALSPDEANDRFGIEGVLKFDKEVQPIEAAWQNRRAKERQYRDFVMSNSDLGPLQALSAGLAGTLVDPISWPLMFVPELLGIGKLAQAAFGARAGAAALKAGRLATAGRFAIEGVAEGAIGGALYEGVNYGLRRYEGDDYTFGDATRNILLGAVLGGAFKGVLGAAIGGRGASAAEAAAEAADLARAPEVRLPEVVEALPENQRAAAAAMAVDRMADDAPVDLAPVIERQRSRDLATLDETGGEPMQVRGRMLDEGVAVTTRGREVPVRFALVEMDDLITSHDTDLVANPDYPQALQPRARDRAGDIARNRKLQAEMNPKLLMRSPGAESGAPIIAPDGVVESGNGRTIALRRAAEEGGEAWTRYQAELAAQGLDATGMDQPVLVRVRSQAMSGEERAALAREMNADVTERMSVTEQAMADAGAMDAALLSLLDGGDVTSAGNRVFARSFLQRVAGDQINTLADAEGRLSAQGVARLKAAITAHAYGDARLVEAVFETADGNIRTIGQALAEAAPGWSRMRAAIARGEAPVELDITANLRAAVDLTRHARDAKIPLDVLIAQRVDQIEMFGGESISPETEAFLRMFFRDEGFKRPRAAARIAAALDDYSRRAGEITPGPDLFGETPDGAARKILEDLRTRLDAADGPDSGGAGQAGGGDLLDALRAEAPEPARVADEPVVIDLQPAGRNSDGPGGSGTRPESGGGPGAAGDRGLAEAPAGAEAPAKTAAAPKAGQALIAADPELKALLDDTLAMEQAEGLTPVIAAADDPDTLAEALRAAAFCIVEGGLG